MNFPFTQWEIDSVLKNNTIEKYNIKSFINSGSYVKYIILEDEENDQEYLGKIGTFTEGEIIHWPQLHHRSLAPFLNSIRINKNINIYILSYSSQLLRDILSMHDFVYHSDCFNKKKIYVEDILWGLDYLHRKSLCLFNISDENIFIYNEEDKAVIVDFSCLARAQVDAKCKFKVPFLYRAPELNEKVFMTDPISTEMWSVGVFILEVFLSHMVPWAMVDFESSRVGEILSKINDILRTANYGSVLDSSSIDQFKAFISAFFRTNPRNRCSARDAAVTEFIQSSKRPPHITNSVSSMKCKASQIGLYSKVGKKTIEEDDLHKIDDDRFNSFYIVNSVSSEKVQASQKSSYAKINKDIIGENISYELDSGLHNFHIPNSVSSEKGKTSQTCKPPEASKITIGENISDEDGNCLHHFHNANSVSSIKRQASTISPNTKINKNTIEEGILQDDSDNCLHHPTKLAIESTPEKASSFITFNGVNFMEESNEITDNSDFNFSKETALPIWNNVNFVNPVAFDIKKRNLCNGTKFDFTKNSDGTSKSISTQTENLDCLFEIPIRDGIYSPDFLINFGSLTNKEIKNENTNNSKSNSHLQLERSYKEDRRNMFTDKLVKLLPNMKPTLNTSPDSLNLPSIKTNQDSCSNRSKSDSQVIVITDTSAPENFSLFQKVREPIKQSITEKFLPPSQTISSDTNKNIFAIDCALKGSFCKGKKIPNVSQKSNFKCSYVAKVKTSNQLSCEQRKYNFIFQPDDVKVADIDKLKIREEPEMRKNVSLIRNYKGNEDTESGTLKPFLTFHQNDCSKKLSYEKRFIDSMFQTDDVKVLSIEKRKIQEVKPQNLFVDLNGNQTFVELDDNIERMRPRTQSENIVNSKERDLVDGNSKSVANRRDSYTKAIAQGNLFSNNIIDSNPETLNKNHQVKQRNQCECLQCQWETINRERRQKHGVVEKNHQTDIIFKSNLSNWQKCKITKHLLKTNESKEILDSKEIGESIFKRHPPLVEKIHRADKKSKKSLKANEIARKKKRKNKCVMHCFGK